MSSSKVGGPTGPKPKPDVTPKVQESKPVQGVPFKQKLQKAGKSKDASPVSQPDPNAQSHLNLPEVSTGLKEAFNPRVYPGANEDAIKAKLPALPQTETAPEATSTEESTEPETQGVKTAEAAPQAVSLDTSLKAVQSAVQPIKEVDAQAEDHTTVASPGSTSTLPEQSSVAPPVQQQSSASPSSAALQAQRTGSQSRMSQVVTPTPRTTTSSTEEPKKPLKTGQHRVVRTPHPAALIEPIIKPENTLFTGSNVPFVFEGDIWYSQLEESRFVCIVHEDSLRILGNLTVEKPKPNEKSGCIILELHTGPPPLFGTWTSTDSETFYFSIPNTFSESELEALRQEQIREFEESQLPSKEENLTPLPVIPDPTPDPIPGEQSPDISGDSGIQLDSDEFTAIAPPDGVMSHDELAQMRQHGPDPVFPPHESAHSDSLIETQADMPAPTIQPAHDPNRAMQEISTAEIAAAAAGLSAGPAASQATAALPNPEVPTLVGQAPASPTESPQAVIPVMRGTGSGHATDQQTFPQSDFASPEELPPAHTETDDPNDSLPEFPKRPKSWGKLKFLPTQPPPRLLDLLNGDTREKPKGHTMQRDDFNVVKHQISQINARIDAQENSKPHAFNMVKFAIGLFALGCVIAGSAIIHLMYRTKPATKEQMYYVFTCSFMLAIMAGFLGITIYFFRIVTRLENNFAHISKWAVASDAKMAQFITNAIKISVPKALQEKMQEQGWQLPAPSQEQTTASFAPPQTTPIQEQVTAPPSHQSDDEVVVQMEFSTPPEEANLEDTPPHAVENGSIDLQEMDISGEHPLPSSPRLKLADAETFDEQAGQDDDGPTVATAPAHPTPAPVTSHTLDPESAPKVPNDQTIGMGLPPEDEYQIPEQLDGFDPSKPLDLGDETPSKEGKPVTGTFQEDAFFLPPEKRTFVDSWLEKTKALFMRKGFVSFMIVWFLVCAAVTTLVTYNNPSEYLMVLGGFFLFFAGTPLACYIIWHQEAYSLHFFFALGLLGTCLAGDSYYIYTYWNSFGEILVGFFPFIIIGTVVYGLISLQTRKFHHKPKETV